jgi:hypothetical protein
VYVDDRVKRKVTGGEKQEEDKKIAHPFMKMIYLLAFG